jgi:hypothetical protein
MFLPNLVKHYLGKYQPLYTEVTPTEAIYKAWVSVHALPPLHPNAPVTPLYYDTNKRFIVRWYEAHIPLLEAMKAENRLLEEGQACNFMRIYVLDEEELVTVLERWKFDWDNLVPHWKIEFPFE